MGFVGQPIRAKATSPADEERIYEARYSAADFDWHPAGVVVHLPPEASNISAGCCWTRVTCAHLKAQPVGFQTQQANGQYTRVAQQKRNGTTGAIRPRSAAAPMAMAGTSAANLESERRGLRRWRRASSQTHICS